MSRQFKRKASAMERISRSRSRSRSRSVTPGPDGGQMARPGHILETPRSRRALFAKALAVAPHREPQVEPEPKLWRPTLALKANVTPGGHIYVGEPVDVFQTPRGTVRRRIPPKDALQKSIHVAVAERVAEAGLDQEEGEEALLYNRAHIEKWMSECQTPEYSERAAGSPSTLVVPPVETTTGSCDTTRVQPVGSPQAGPSGTQRPVVVAPGDTHGPSSSEVVHAFQRAVPITNEGSEFDSDFDDEFNLNEFAGSAAAARDIPPDDELAEPERNIVNNISRAMDEAVDRLVGVSTDFSWQDNFDTFRGQPEVFSGPTPGPINDYDTPYDAFTSIWSKDIMDLIVRETNRYAKQTIDELKAAGKWSSSCRLYRWTDTCVDEIYVFFALYIYMGIDIRSAQHEYWKTSNNLEMLKFKRFMSFNRFILLNKCLHFVDNSDASQSCLHNEGVVLSAKLKKIAPVIHHLNSTFSKLYHLRQDIAIDESLTLFKGRLSWVQAIRSKAARFGIKSFELCESRTGYLYKFEIYTGKNSDRDNTVAPSADLAGKSTQVVLDLLKGLEHRGHLVTMDNFYNCPSLSRYLKSLGFDSLGTLRPNRKHVPVEIAKAPKNVPKGTIIARHSGDLTCLAWKDSKIVCMISTYHTDETFVGRKAGRDLVKPVAVRDYNNTMGGVDLKDQKLSMYLLERKRCIKWYMKIFKRLLNVSVLNAFILHSESLRRRGMSALAHRAFRVQLADSLTEKHYQCPPTQGNLVTDPAELRLRRDVRHVPHNTTGNANRKSCCICYRLGKRKLVRTKCAGCDEFMCLGICWETWHYIEHLPGKDINIRKSRRT